MGAGLWTSEEIKFHPETGALLTKNTWVSLLQQMVYTQTPSILCWSPVAAWIQVDSKLQLWPITDY